MGTSSRPTRERPDGEHDRLSQRVHAHDEYGPETRRIADLRALQRTTGNRAVSRLLGGHDALDGRGSPQSASRAVSTAVVGAGTGRGPGSTEHSMHTTDVALRSKIGIEKVAPNATALGALGGDYGITWPQQIRVTLGTKLAGDDWVPTVSDVVGDYSVQARILGHQTDVTDASVATQVNYQAILAALDSLGVPGNTQNWYSLKAVQAHESKHATRALQALMDVREAMEKRIALVTVARANNQETAAQAVTRIEAAPGYALALQACFELWDDRFDELIDGDHTGNGPCELAEKSITVPLAKAIRERAKTERWLAPPPMVPLF